MQLGLVVVGVPAGVAGVAGAGRGGVRQLGRLPRVVVVVVAGLPLLSRGRDGQVGAAPPPGPAPLCVTVTLPAEVMSPSNAPLL